MKLKSLALSKRSVGRTTATKPMHPLSGESPPLRRKQPVPRLKALTAGLSTVMCGNGSRREILTVLDRTPSVYASTYPSEVITCRIGNHRGFKLYCKYMTDGGGPNGYGHRGGVPYEVEVYRRVLDPLQLSVPRFYGSYEDFETGELWLVLEYLDQSMRMTKGPQPETVVKAARWIGQFHAANEGRISDEALSLLNRYSSNYYLGWVHRTSRFSRKLRHKFPWAQSLCKHLEEFIEILLSPPLTIIHGEYYPHNIVIRRSVIYPIDWESTSIAAGEIDLATLTEGWGDEIARQCEFEYRRARWGAGSSADFERRLAAARLYLSFRWLGERPDWTAGDGNSFYFDQLRSVGEEFGVV
jgi:hypothetical protein